MSICDVPGKGKAAKNLPIYTVYAYPCLKSEPDAYKRAVQNTDPVRQASTLREYCEPTNYMVCAKVKNTLAGVAIWECHKDRLRHVPLHLRFLRLVLSVYDTITPFLYPNWLQRIINPSKHAELAGRKERLSKIIVSNDSIRKNHLPSEMNEGTYWTLSVLGVSEEYGRRGIGTRLLQWGCERADADDKSIFVCASQEGAALYKKNGFQVVHHVSQLLYDPIRGWMDQTYLVRWNKSRRV